MSNTSLPSPTGEDAVALTALGFDSRVEVLFASLDPEDVPMHECTPGRVARVDRGAVTVHVDGAIVRAELATPVRQLAELGDAASLPAAGDWVAVRPRPEHELDLIEAILPRTSVFIRRAPEARGDQSERMRPQVLAANVDIAFLVAAATDTRAGRLERLGVVAFESGATPVIALTKADLLADPAASLRVAAEALPGVPVHLVDSLGGEGVEAIRAYLAGGKTAVFLGASGVGKSTLTNALVGHEVLETGEVREADGRGRHTTTARHLVPLPGGGALIDTPGIRSIATWGASEGIDLVFAEIEAAAATCRFADCAHRTEPDCGVLEALEAGEIDAKRLERYQRVQRERAHEESKGDPRARADLVANQKRIQRYVRGREDVKRKRGKDRR